MSTLFDLHVHVFVLFGWVSDNLTICIGRIDGALNFPFGAMRKQYQALWSFWAAHLEPTLAVSSYVGQP